MAEKPDSRQASAAGAAQAAPVALRPITADTVRAVCALAVAPSQAGLVAPNAVSLAQALFAPTAWYRAIHAGDALAGFLMLDDPSLAGPVDGPPAIYLWRFMVDARWQGRGIGRAALRLAMDHARARGATQLLLSCVPGPGSPQPFYRAMGFVETGAVDEDGEVAMAAPLP